MSVLFDKYWTPDGEETTLFWWLLTRNLVIGGIAVINIGLAITLGYILYSIFWHCFVRPTEESRRKKLDADLKRYEERLVRLEKIMKL
jgi:hypothetical protein